MTFMKKSSSEMSTGAALLLTLGCMLFIGWIISLTVPKCSMSGCDNEAREDSRYCYLHNLSYESYGNPDYNAVYRASQNRKKSYTSKSSSSTSASSDSSSTSVSKSTQNTYSSSSSKKYDPYESYDEGYDDVYMDDDYDWDRYWSDSDYADGVDDAMDEFDW